MVDEETVTRESVTVGINLRLTFDAGIRFTGRAVMQKTSTNQPIQRASLNHGQPVIQQTDEDDDSLYPQKPPSSARRYTPVTPVATATTTTEPLAPPTSKWKVLERRALIVALISLLIFLVGDTLGYSVYDHYNKLFSYGTNLTYQTYADVGHGGMSHLIAYTESDKVEVLEIVGNKSTVYDLSLPSPEKRLVMLVLTDIRGNGKPDIALTIDGLKQHPMLINTGSAFRWGVE